MRDAAIAGTGQRESRSQVGKALAPAWVPVAVGTPSNRDSTRRPARRHADEGGWRAHRRFAEMPR